MKNLFTKQTIINIIGAILVSAIIIYSDSMMYQKEVIVTNKEDVKRAEQTIKPSQKTEEAPKADSADGGSIQLKAVDEDEYGIDSDATFVLTSEKPLTVETVKKYLTIEPKQPLEIAQKSTTEYYINPTKAFKKHSVIKLKYSGDETYGWAFQTKRAFNITGTMPALGGRDVPVNSGIEIYFTKAVEGEIDDYFSIEPEVEGSFEYMNNKVIFKPANDFNYDAQYKVTVAKGYTVKGEALQEDYIFSFNTSWRGSCSVYSFKGKQALLHENVGQALVIQAYDNDINNEDALVNIYKLKDEAEYIELTSDRYNIDLIKDSDKFAEIVNYNEMYSFTGTAIISNSHWYETGYVEIPENLKRGYYIAEMTISNVKCYQLLQVTPYDSYVAVDSNNIFIWCVNAETGEPGSGCEVSIDGDVVGTTAEDGTFVMSNDEQLDNEEEKVIVIAGEQGKTIANVSGTQEYYYDTYYNRLYDEQIKTKEYWQYLYTDREIYSATDEVNIFGFAQKRNGEGIDNLRVTIEYDDVIVDEETVNLSDIGSYKCTFNLENCLYHWLHINVYDGEDCIGREYLRVSEITLPKYKVTSHSNKEYLMSGDEVTVEVKATYYEGTPMKNGQLSYSSYNMTWDHQNKGVVKTDENGEASFTIRPSVDYESWRPERCSLGINSDELEEYKVYASEQYIIFPRDIMVEATVEEIDNQTINLKFNANNIDIRHFSGNRYDEESYKGMEAGDVPITVTVTEYYYEKIDMGQRYDYIHKKTIDLFEYKRIENTLDNLKGVTNADGKLVLPFDQVKEGRSYNFEIISKDRKGRQSFDRLHYSKQVTEVMDYYDKLWSLRSATNKNRLQVGEKLEVHLEYDQNKVADTDNNMVMYMIYKEGLVEYKLAKDLEETFEFSEDYIPNAYVVPIYFDGTYMIKTGEDYIYYDSDEKKLDIKIDTDSKNYKPGDEVTVNCKVEDQGGNPVVADVCINVVDEALLAVYPNESNMLETLYTPVFSPGIISETLFTQTNPNEFQRCMAECGEGGEPDYIRDDFKLTALFKKLKTDETGRGSATFTIPDSLTSWEVNVRAVTKDISAGQNATSIKCKLPYFIDLVMFDRYITGDTVGVTVQTSGTDVTRSTPVTYKVILTDEQGKEVESTKTDIGLRYNSFDLGQLDKGHYKVTVYSSSDGYNDAMAREFDVVDTMQYFEVRKDEILSEQTTFKAYDNPVILRLLNRESHEHFNNIYTIYNHRWSTRGDIKVAAYMAGQYLNDYYGEELDLSVADSFKAYMYNGQFKPLTYDSVSAEMTARVLLSGILEENILTDQEIEQMKLSLNYALKDEDITVEENYYALLALAVLGEPVLLEANAMYTEEIEDLEDIECESSALMLAYIYLGDINKGKGLYEKLRDNLDHRKDYVNYRKGLAHMLTAAILLEEEDDAHKIYAELDSIRDTYTPTVIERLLYLKTYKPDVKTCSFNYSLNNETVNKTIDHHDIVKLSLTGKEASQISFTNIKGDISVISESIGTVKDGTPLGDLEITREYYLDGKKIEEGEINIGDEIEVSLRVTGRRRQCIVINDILPSGFVFKNTNTNDYRSGYYRVNGHDVTVYGYIDKSLSFSTRYTAVAVNAGEYTADYCVVKDDYGVGYNYDQQKKIKVH